MLSLERRPQARLQAHCSRRSRRERVPATAACLLSFRYSRYVWCGDSPCRLALQCSASGDKVYVGTEPMGKRRRSIEFELGRPASRRNRAWLCFALGIMMLGFAVVCWGLHDKLSLYTPPHAKPVSAKAKLLSEAERPGRVAAAAPVSLPNSEPGAPSAVLLAIAAWSFTLLFPSCGPGWSGTPRSSRYPVAVLVAPGNSAPRPPPSLI